MIGYVTIGTNNLDRSRAFFEALLATIGAKKLFEMPDDQGGLTMYGASMTEPCVSVTRPYDGGAATPGNGQMVAFELKSREQVAAFHAKAIELGASDEGAPGLRGSEDMGFYGAYFRDPDGNKFAAFNFGGKI